MRARDATSSWSVQAQHHGPTRLRGRLASCHWPLRSVGRTIYSDWTNLPINSVDAYSDCILQRSELPMLIFKYFLYVGSLLSVLLFAWSVYLEPPAAKVRASPPSANSPEVFRPTPAPPIVEAELQPVGETPELSTANARSNDSAKIARAKQKKRRTQVARRPAAPERSFAYFPQRQFFFDWRY